MKKRLWICEIVLLLGLGAVFLLNSNGAKQPMGVKMELPERVGYDWVGEDRPVGPAELILLAADTEFKYKLYRDSIGDQIMVRIVLSGRDMKNSIHRPESCLTAQGWTIDRASIKSVKLDDDGKTLRVTRLLPTRVVMMDEKKSTEICALTEYLFIGAGRMTPSHFGRTLYDIYDRVVHGKDQRWAYVTFESLVTAGVPNSPLQRTESDTEAVMDDFIAQILPTILVTKAGEAKKS